MNFRNRKLVITIRTLLGLMFVFSGVSGLMAGAEMKGVPEPMIAVSQQLWHMGIFQMIKMTEIVGGAMLVLGFLPALAAIFVAPICVGIIVFDLHVAPAFLPAGIVVSAMTSYLGYAYWEKYKALFQRG